jgi:putative acetyltransferase
MSGKSAQVATVRAPVSIAIESPEQAEVIKLVIELDRHLHSLYPPASIQVLSIDDLAKKDVRFFVARREGKALGCGALRIDRRGKYGEVKRMFVLPTERGSGIGRELLKRVAAEAVSEELMWLRLETGIHQPESLALYRSFGFAKRGPFGKFKNDPLSVFLEKAL